MKKFLLVVSVLIGLGSVTAQSFVRMANHIPGALKITGQSDTLKILAVMVEFQQDNDPNTYGTGKFGTIYTQAYGDTILDPLPHDAQYFKNHLEFAKNYFNKVSNGNLNIEYTVLPQVVTVSKTMREYSPAPTNTSDLSSEVQFAQEVWQLAGTSIDFSKFDLFTIFHAGVGRELTPPGSIGTERDLYSVYLGLSSLRSYLGNSFNGFSVNGGNYLIQNTLILPSTESREVETISGSVLIELTTNGLIVSSIASHLGLPDLFNTETGTSAIGRLGLMDGESIFGYGGIFPAAPSAWEKIYLGWAKAVEVPVVNRNFVLTASQIASINDTTILKIPINSTEYYLVENRERDVNKDGSKLTYKIGTQNFAVTFDSDTSGYQWYDVYKVNGVVTDVDEPDWAAPGNGIVIWHIDENIINQKIAEDKINSDIDHKGIAVVEADGIYDIGRSFTDIFGETVIGQAYQEDMWYAANPSNYYENKFNDYTKPSAKANSGAFSLINIQNFSAPGNKMSFNLSFGSDYVDLLASNKLDLSAGTKYLSANYVNSVSYSYVVNGSTLMKYNGNGTLEKSIPDFSSRNVAAAAWNNGEFVAGVNGQQLNVYIKDASGETLKSYNLGKNATSIPVIQTSGSDMQIMVGTEDGVVHDLLFTSAYEIKHGSTGDNKLSDEPIRQICANGNYFSAITDNYFCDVNKHSVQINGALKAVMSKYSWGQYYTVVLDNKNSFSVISDNADLVPLFTVNSGTVSSFSMADLFGTGENSILVNNGTNLEVYNFKGTLADNFPVSEPNTKNFTGAPVVADLQNDGIVEVISVAEDGNVYAINSSDGKTVLGFPVSSGTSTGSAPVLLGNNGIQLAVLNSADNLYLWNVSSQSGTIYWSGEFGNSANTSYVEPASSENKITEFFPNERAYNWPNPVYGGETNIRYFVSENSTVQVKIFDLAGDLVAELSGIGQGGIDNEIVWNVSGIESGVYLVHIEAISSTGQSASKIIKIAVIK